MHEGYAGGAGEVLHPRYRVEFGIGQQETQKLAVSYTSPHLPLAGWEVGTTGIPYPAPE